MFFSWESDLPASDTRQLIIDVLDETAKDGYAISDRDTKGEAGSPSIDEVIFRKIDECDVFVADISIINQKFVDKQKKELEENSDVKHSTERPVMNPNVMLELGYAVSTKGWENVCLLFNTEYGDKESLPFDIRQHRRVDFSTRKTDDISKTKARENAKQVIRRALEEQINQTRALATRPKRGYSFFVVGGFDGKIVEATVNEYSIKDNPVIDRHIAECCEEASRIIDQIMDIKIDKKEEKPISSLRYYDIVQDKLKRVTISDNAKEAIIRLSKKYLYKELDEDFFDLGDLIRNEYSSMIGGDSLQGTESEKEKFKLLKELLFKYKLIDLINELVGMFDGVKLIPLAIHNISTVSDSDVKIKVHVEHSYEINGNDMPEFIRKNGGYIFDKGFIADLFYIKHSANISYDRDITIDASDHMRVLRDLNPLSNQRHTFEDMLQEIQKYVANPISDGVYQYEISNLLANEIKWLGPMIAVKKTGKPMIIEYEILSQKSDGTISGSCTLEA